MGPTGPRVNLPMMHGQHGEKISYAMLQGKEQLLSDYRCIKDPAHIRQLHALEEQETKTHEEKHKDAIVDQGSCHHSTE